MLRPSVSGLSDFHEIRFKVVHKKAAVGTGLWADIKRLCWKTEALLLILSGSLTQFSGLFGWLVTL